MDGFYRKIDIFLNEIPISKTLSYFNFYYSYLNVLSHNSLFASYNINEMKINVK